MKLDEAKSILEKNGYMTEAADKEQTAKFQMQEFVRVANVMQETLTAATDAGYTVTGVNAMGYFLYNPSTKNTFAVNVGTDGNDIVIGINKNSFEDRTKPKLVGATTDMILEWIQERD